jgi:diadenosine tetraphosphatase ApaH/serine/threonine PP2A family protein phosphatase
MRLALMSDLHANMLAFQACLDDAKTQNVTDFAILGDLVGYCAQPAEVVDAVMALAAEGAAVVYGNHDLLVVKPDPENKSLGASTAVWTSSQLSEVHRNFIGNLPLTKQLEDILLAHASAESPERWLYVENEMRAASCLDAASKLEGIRHVFVGHYHHQGLYYQGTGRGLMFFEPTVGSAIPVPKHRQWVATVGSVGQPRDGDPRSMYAIYDDESETLTFRRVSYDHFAAAALIRKAGLAEFFAERLENGK